MGTGICLDSNSTKLGIFYALEVVGRDPQLQVRKKLKLYGLQAKE